MNMSDESIKSFGITSRKDYIRLIKKPVINTVKMLPKSKKKCHIHIKNFKYF